MKSTFSILLIEDDALDIQLIAHQLKASGLSHRLKHICTEAELRRELETELPDLILSDHGLPSFSGFKALEIVRATNPGLPFIFVSGSNDQGKVTKMYEEGATDYVYKRDIGDLRAAVLRALNQEFDAERVRKQAGATAREQELKLQIPAASATQPVFSLGIIHLSFCPQCRRARNEAGEPVHIEDCCDTHGEVVILRQVCAECRRSRKAG